MSIELPKEKITGGWSAYLSLTDENKKLFYTTSECFKVVIHKPFYVSSQIVFSGINFRFKCIASIVETEVVWESIIEIHAPLKGRPHIISIIKI